MLYQETYQAGGDPAKMNLSSVTYVREIPSTPPPDSTDNMQYHVSAFPMHCHSFYEMNYTADGSAEAEFGNRLITLHPGTLTFYTPLTVHRNQKDLRTRQIVLQFSPRFVQQLFSSRTGNAALFPAGALMACGSVTVREDSSLYPAIGQLLDLSPCLNTETDDVSRPILSFPPLLEIRLCAALTALLSSMMQEGMLRLSDTNVDFHAHSLMKMQALLSRLISAPEEKLSMEEAAAMVNMSYSNFCRTFQSIVGMSYVDFCNSVRVRRAKELLLHTNLSVTEISARLNFGSISYFNRIFKKYSGSTPLAYRAAR